MDIEEPTAGFVALRASETGFETLLVLKRKHGLFGYPKGHREAGETVIQAAIRELREESGCVPEWFLTEAGWSRDFAGAIEVPPLVREYERSSTGQMCRKTTQLYVALVREVEPLHDHGEIERIEWFPLTEETAKIFRRANERKHYEQAVLSLQLPSHP